MRQPHWLKSSLDERQNQ